MSNSVPKERSTKEILDSELLGPINAQDFYDFISKNRNVETQITKSVHKERSTKDILDSI